MNLQQWKMETKIGVLYLVASDRGLRGIFWKKQSAPLTRSPGEVLLGAIAELEEYFEGKRKKFTVPLDPIGTPFQRKVWSELGKIPYGKTFSYREVAVQIKNKNAVRAVGTANGKNPLSIIVPCHRVIASDGSLGGYAGGLKIKTWLLAHEGVKGFLPTD